MSRSRRRYAPRMVSRTRFEQLEGRRLLSGAPPNPIDHMLAITEDSGQVRVPVITVDILNGDPPNEPLEIVSVTAVGEAVGTVEIDTFVVFYTPAPDFSGTDTFTYTVTDSFVDPEVPGLSGTANISIVVTPQPDAPVAQDDQFFGSDAAAVTGNLLLNDSDVDGDTLVLETSAITGPQNGSVTLNGDGSFSYSPNPGFSGQDSFVYRVTDGSLTDTASVSITINGSPVAEDDAFSVGEDAVLMGNVLNTNGGVADSDPDGDMLSVSTAASPQPANGTLALNADGTFTYTPNANYHGPDAFGYSVTDGTNSDSAIVSITVTPMNDPPVANDDSASGPEDSVIAGNVLLGQGADSDIEGDTLSVAVQTQPTNGSLQLNSDGAYSYTPNTNFNGEDSFTYEVSDGTLTDTATVRLTIDAVNDAPVASDDQFSGPFEMDVTGNVLTNSGGGADTDIDSDTLSISTALFTQPTGGTVMLQSSGVFTYSPNSGFSGTDSFEYTVTDGELSDTGLVTIVISPADNLPPTARDDSFSVSEDGMLTGDVLADNGNGSDSDPDDTQLTVVGTAQVPQNGSLMLRDDGEFTYVPDPNFNGIDSFAYQLQDGRGGASQAVVTINVQSVNDAPVAEDDLFITQQGMAISGDVLALNGDAADSDIDMDMLAGGVTLETEAMNGLVELNPDGTFTYTPNSSFGGADTFVYRVSDGELSDTATVTIEVNAVVNTPPVAQNDNFTVPEDGSLPGNVIVDNGNGADSDPDGDRLSTLLTNPTMNGEVLLEADGNFTYVPNANFNGTDSFSYSISDGREGVDVAEVSITVDPVDDIPVAQDDTFTIAADMVLTGDLLADNGNGADSDPDGGGVTVRPTRLRPQNGIAILNLDGTFEYTPTEGFSGTDRFSYTLRDADGDVVVAFVNISIDDLPNGAPVAVNDTFVINENAVATGNVLADNGAGADSDPNGDTLEVSLVTDTVVGELNLSGDGSFTWTPPAGFAGEDGFVYQISDQNGGSDTAEVRIVVNVVNEAPIAKDDQFVVRAGEMLTGSVLADNGNGPDEDPDQDALMVEPNELPTNGELILASDGTFIYTPNAAFSGTDEFTYTLTDESGASHVATVTITVEAGEVPPPVAVVSAIINQGADLPDRVDTVAYTFSGVVENSHRPQRHCAHWLGGQRHRSHRRNGDVEPGRQLGAVGPSRRSPCRRTDIQFSSLPLK